MFGRRRDQQAKQGQPPEAMGADLRQMVLGLQPRDIGISGDTEDSVFGVVMDTTFDDGAWFTLVCLKDGTVSLYTSGTFGIIGAGQHPHIRAAAAQLIDRVQNDSTLFAPATSRELPQPGMVTLRALTPAGHRQVTGPEDDLGHERHPASPVFYSAHEVISLVRSASAGGSGP